MTVCGTTNPRASSMACSGLAQPRLQINLQNGCYDAVGVKLGVLPYCVIASVLQVQLFHVVLKHNVHQNSKKMRRYIAGKPFVFIIVFTEYKEYRIYLLRPESHNLGISWIKRSTLSNPAPASMQDTYSHTQLTSSTNSLAR